MNGGKPMAMTAGCGATRGKSSFVQILSAWHGHPDRAFWDKMSQSRSVGAELWQSGKTAEQLGSTLIINAEGVSNE